MGSYRSTQQSTALPLLGIAIGAVLGFARGYVSHALSGAIYYAVAFALAGFVLGALALLVLRMGPIGVFIIALASAAVLFVSGVRLPF